MRLFVSASARCTFIERNPQTLTRISCPPPPPYEKVIFDPVRKNTIVICPEADWQLRSSSADTNSLRHVARIRSSQELCKQNQLFVFITLFWSHEANGALLQKIPNISELSERSTPFLRDKTSKLPQTINQICFLVPTRSTLPCPPEHRKINQARESPLPVVISMLKESISNKKKKLIHLITNNIRNCFSSLWPF